MGLSQLHLSFLAFVLFFQKIQVQAVAFRLLHSQLFARGFICLGLHRLLRLLGLVLGQLLLESCDFMLVRCLEFLPEFLAFRGY